MILGIGTDIIEIRRVRKTLTRFPERFAHRVFTEGERSFCFRSQDPVPGLAARFAAKEAFMKAIGTGFSQGIYWQNVEVTREPGRAPEIKLSGRAAELATEKGVSKIHLSITHGTDFAVAFVILEK